MTSGKQLELWLKGKPSHNDERNECCPGFSCCKPELLAPLHERKAFLKVDQSGNEEARMSLLGTFLGRALALASEKKIYIAGTSGKKPDPKETY